MREALAQIEGKKSLFYGEFSKYGWRKFMGQYVEKTLLLVNIRDKQGNLICDHLWFHLTKGFEKLGELKKGQILKFEARVQSYTKHRGEDVDYHLAWPQDLKIVEGTTLREEGQLALD